MFNGSMLFLVDVVQQDSITVVPGDGNTNAISFATSRKMCTLP